MKHLLKKSIPLVIAFILSHSLQAQDVVLNFTATPASFYLAAGGTTQALNIICLANGCYQ